LEIGRIKVRGSADRIEIDDQGAHFIVDLKTSHDAMKAKEAESNQQLATYQAALALGAFEGIEASENLGGAELVYPATDAKKVTTRSQSTKDPDEDCRDFGPSGRDDVGGEIRCDHQCELSSLRSSFTLPDARRRQVSNPMKRYSAKEIFTALRKIDPKINLPNARTGRDY